MRKPWQIVLPVVLATSSNCQLLPDVQAETVKKDTAIITPKALSDSIKHALSYLVSQQQENGGWSQGTESANMGSSMGDIATKANVGDTCMAGLALVQAGSFPNAGEYAKNVAKAADFVCGKVALSDDASLSVTDLQGTRIQMKLGPNIDTFLASLFLTEVRNHTRDKEQQVKVAKALDKVLDKMEKNQHSDGQWAAGGWAPVHAQAIATKALNLAKQEGASVSDAALARAQSNAEKSFDAKSGGFGMAGAANVPLYAAGATLAALQQSINTGKSMRYEASRVLAGTPSPKEREEARGRLDRLESAQRVQSSATAAVVDRLKDDNFVRGFGCNGGEEFLSYLDISEALKENDTKKWQEFNSKITGNLERIQNQDGSWMGQHCITSKTFVTAAAILVLTVDRESSTRADKIRRRT